MMLLTEALATAIKIADEAREEWDNAPSGMRAGKLLIALSGHCPGYRADIDAIHATLKHFLPVPVTLRECPPGLFYFDGTLGFKSEYSGVSGVDAYVVESGEYFWGRAKTKDERANLLVLPARGTLHRPRSSPSP